MAMINISGFVLANITFPSVSRSTDDSFNTTPLAVNRKPNANGRQPLYAQVIIVLMYILIIIIAVGGNLLFSYVILTRPKMRSVTNLFLLNLAISDIVKAVICNPFAFMANLILLHWPYGDFMCPMVTYVQVVAVFLSAFTLVAMSVDRYLAILNPLRPKMSKRVFVVTVSIIWILAFAAPLPTAITSRVVFDEGHPNGLCLEEFEDKYNKYIYSVLIMMSQYFVPLAVITVTNSHIGYIVWIKKTPGEAAEERDRRMAASQTTSGEDDHHRRRHLRRVLATSARHHTHWRQQPENLQHATHERRVAMRSLASNVPLLLQPNCLFFT